MAVNWRLKTYLAKSHNIFKAADLRRKIIEETNIQISKQQICNLLNGKPKSIKLKTIEVICTALNCKLSDFCEVKFGKIKSDRLKKLSFETTTYKARCKSNLPNPRDYE